MEDINEQLPAKIVRMTYEIDGQVFVITRQASKKESALGVKLLQAHYRPNNFHIAQGEK